MYVYIYIYIHAGDEVFVGFMPSLTAVGLQGRSRPRAPRFARLLGGSWEAPFFCSRGWGPYVWFYEGSGFRVRVLRV